MTTTTPAATDCPPWCIADHSRDLHGEHFHRSDTRSVRDNRGAMVPLLSLRSFTADDGDFEEPLLLIGEEGRFRSDDVLHQIHYLHYLQGQLPALRRSKSRPSARAPD